MAKLVSQKLIVVYLILFTAFKYIFSLINPLYLVNLAKTPHAIDIHPWACKVLFDKDYIIDAKHLGYDHSMYYRTFLPLDLVFPLIYTLLFLSILQAIKKPVVYKCLFILILAGGLFDYLEDLSFSWFLTMPNDTWAAAVAFFSSLKTVLFIFNLLTAAAILAYTIFKWVKMRSNKSS